MSAKKIAVIYVNPIEYHGPHLTLKNDFYISLGLAERLKSRIKEKDSSVTFTDYEIHKGSGPAPGPGSEHTPINELSQLVKETCAKAINEGANFMLFMTFHGAPSHALAIESGLKFAHSKNIPAYNPFNLVMHCLRDYDPEWIIPFAPLVSDETYRQKWIATLPTDFHGGLLEGSIMMALDPTKVLPIYKTLPDCPDREIGVIWKAVILLSKALGLRNLSKELMIAADGHTWTYMKPHLGYTGAPRLISGELGEKIVEIFINDYEQAFWKIAQGQEKSPKPILQWAARA